jgi:hypothetical protein
MEIKLKLDTKKASKTAIAIAAAYGLCRVSEGTKSPQLATANTFALIVIVTILYGPRPVPKNSAKAGMTPDAIMLLFREAHEAFPPFEGKPMDGNLMAVRETLLPILSEIPYDQLGGGSTPAEVRHRTWWRHVQTPGPSAAL